MSLLDYYRVSDIRPDAATEERLAAELGTRGDEARQAVFQGLVQFFPHKSMVFQ